MEAINCACFKLKEKAVKMLKMTWVLDEENY